MFCSVPFALKGKFPLFVWQVKLVRGWSTEQAEAEWQRLLADPQVLRDHQGIRGSLRLYVPPEIVAEAYHNKVRTREESKAFQDVMRVEACSA